MTAMSKLFISHSSKDDAFVRELRRTLADHGHDGWIDSRELRGGDALWPEIQKAIEEASGFAFVVSTDSLQSDWVADEVAHAVRVRRKRGAKNYRLIPLALDGAGLGALGKLVGKKPLFLSVSRAAGGVEAAMNDLLAAMGERLPAEVPPTPQPTAEPLEELVLELTDFRFVEVENTFRASARARLVYQPATLGSSATHSAKAWRLVAPIGPIEAAEIRWYLEQYVKWPSGISVIQDRARRVVESLAEWGARLYEVAMPLSETANVREAWAKIAEHAGRRFSVHVDLEATLEADATKEQRKEAQEVSTVLLGLPWELLHDRKSYLFQGKKPTRVRRQLASTESYGVPVVDPPIRILLITARPEDDACGYIDHRASALPLVEAMESLPGLVEIRLLSPPTLSALREELDRADTVRQPYHVVHFNGHGVYDQAVGLGGLCFELPEDERKLEKRGHVTIFTNDLGPLLRDYRIPLVFLEACQSAQAEKASESVASELLKVGVASVVAMSHSILVATARLFVGEFYRALAAGKRVGDAMLAGQRRLKDDTFREQIFGKGELRLEDWFVPVLFQEKDDPQLFKTTPAKQTVEDWKKALADRLGDLPPTPATGFVGRSRELLALERLLRNDRDNRYAVVRGQGGEGKTALAAEFARWMVRSQQVRRAAFVSVETHGNAASVLNEIGRQLAGESYSVAFDTLEKSILPIERALREQSTLLVVDNMESILLPPYLDEEMPNALTEEAARELKAILDLCARLLKAGDTRLVFTSRETLPAPFDGARNRRELFHLGREDAVKLVERVLNESSSSGTAGTGKAYDAAREAIEALVDAVYGHARTLTLLAPSLRARGVEATREALVELMEEMDRRFPVGSPESREKSVFASVELSLRRLSLENQTRARVLGVFHGAVDLDVLRVMKQWEMSDITALAGELVETGLATPNPYNHLTLDPALCPYLRGRMDGKEREALTARWVEAMIGYVEFLRQQQSQSTEVVATLTGLELPNLFALLDRLERARDQEATIGLATSLYGLLQWLGKPRLLERVGQVRDAAAEKLEAPGGAWSHARFEAARTRVEQQWGQGRLREALEGAQILLERARAAGVQSYPGADYDLGGGCFLLARVWKTAGGSERALPLLDEAHVRFESVAEERPHPGAGRMAAACFAEQGDCLLFLGRLDEAAAAYEVSIHRSEQLGEDRQVAVGKGQLGTVRLAQRLYPEALAAHKEARERFTRLNEPGIVAVSWHQTGITHQEAGQPEAAEEAYRKSLAISVRLGNLAGQASTLLQLGNLYKEVLGRPEEAVAFYRQATDKYVVSGDLAHEGRARSNLGETLRKLRRFDEALEEIRRAIECKAPYGHASEPWTTWAILSDIETDAGQPAAAAEARAKAIAGYLAYRGDGGENHTDPGRISLAVTRSLLAEETDEAAALLQQQLPRFEAAGFGGFIRALQAIVGGSRDVALAENPEFHPTMAAEILFLIETLQKAGR